MSKEQIIVLGVAGTDLTFKPTMQDYNKFVNEMMPDNKIAPAHNYLRRIVDKESKEALNALLTKPGAALQLAAKVNDQFVPELEIEVKN